MPFLPLKSDLDDFFPKRKKIIEIASFHEKVTLMPIQKMLLGKSQKTKQQFCQYVKAFWQQAVSRHAIKINKSFSRPLS